MRKRLAGLALALGLSVGLTAPAQAFTPGGTFTLSGPMTMTVGGTIASCTLTMIVYAPPGGSAQVVSATLTPIPGSTTASCASMSPRNLPWAVTTPAPTMITISPVYFSSTFSCLVGAATGTWSNAAATLTWTNVPAPPICTLGGTFTAAPVQTLP